MSVPPNTKFLSTIAGSVFRLNFADKPISRQTVSAFMRACSSHIIFGEIDSEQLRQVAETAHVRIWSAGEQGERDLDVFQAQSIYRQVVLQYNIDNFGRLLAETDEMRREYDEGAAILEISEKHRLSPYAIFKRVVECDREKLKYLAMGKIQASDVFASPRDIEQYHIAQKYDYSSVAAQLKIAQDSQKREDNFVGVLRQIGIKFKTQSELFEEAMKQRTRPITPDVLFLSNVSVNGELVKWIDFKAYFGVSVPFIASSLRKQYKKYAKTFGHGLFAFEHGFVAGMSNAVSVRALRDIIDEGTR